MTSADGLDSLSTALRAAVPPIFTICVIHTCLVDKAFFVSKLVGEFLPRKLRAALTRVYFLVGVGVPVALLPSVWYACGFRPHAFSTLRFEANYFCLPALSAATLLGLFWMCAERAVLAYLAFTSRYSTFTMRSADATALASCFACAATNDPTALLLLLFVFTNRTLPVFGPSTVAASNLLRVVVKLYLFAVGTLMLANLSECRADRACRVQPRSASLLVALALVR